MFANATKLTGLEELMGLDIKGALKTTQEESLSIQSVLPSTPLIIRKEAMTICGRMESWVRAEPNCCRSQGICGQQYSAEESGFSQ